MTSAESLDFPEGDRFLVRDFVRQLLAPPELPVHRRPAFRDVTLVAVRSIPFRRLPMDVLWAAAALRERGLGVEVRDAALEPESVANDPDELVRWLGAARPNVVLWTDGASLPAAVGAAERWRRRGAEGAVLLCGAAVEQPGPLLQAFPALDAAMRGDADAAAVAMAERRRGEHPRWPRGLWSRTGERTACARGPAPAGLRARLPAYRLLPLPAYEKDFAAELTLRRAGAARAEADLLDELALLRAAGLEGFTADARALTAPHLVRLARLASRVQAAWLLEQLDPRRMTPALLRTLARHGLAGVRFRPVQAPARARVVLEASRQFAAHGVPVFVPLGWGRPAESGRTFGGLLDLWRRLQEAGAHPRFELLEPRAGARRLELLPDELAPPALRVAGNRALVEAFPRLFPAHVFEPHRLFEIKAAKVRELEAAAGGTPPD